jgi:hypothetical protein
LGQWWVVVAAGLVGALGAVTSALQRSTRVTSGVRTPERIGLLGAALLRPFIGLVAGLSAYLTARTLSPEEHQVAVALLASFGAGFTERLLMRGEYDQRDEPRRSGVDDDGGEDARSPGAGAAPTGEGRPGVPFRRRPAPSGGRPEAPPDDRSSRPRPPTARLGRPPE